MTFAAASTRWWLEKGEARADAKCIELSLAWLQINIGKGAFIRTIDNNVVARLVATRQADGVSAATVNRSMTEPLRAILRRAVEIWNQDVPKINWGAHLLKEPQERIREMSLEEEAKLFAAMRADFRPILRFVLITGLRRAEACRLKWAHVDFDGARIIVHGKGDAVDSLPLPDAALAILRAEHKNHNHSEFVFTFEATGKRGGRKCQIAYAKGQRVAICPETLSTAFRRARKAAGLAEADLRLHDIRHTAATRLTRTTGNLKLTQKMLRHKRITTTARYAHATDDDLRAAMNKMAPVASAVESPVESPAEAVQMRSKA